MWEDLPASLTTIKIVGGTFYVRSFLAVLVDVTKLPRLKAFPILDIRGSTFLEERCSLTYVMIPESETRLAIYAMRWRSQIAGGNTSEAEERWNALVKVAEESASRPSSDDEALEDAI